MGVSVALLGVAAGALDATHPHVGTVSRISRAPRGRGPWDFGSRSIEKRYTRTRAGHVSARIGDPRECKATLADTRPSPEGWMAHASDAELERSASIPAVERSS